MGDNHHPTGGGSFCPSTRSLNDPPWDVRLFRWIPWLQSDRDSEPINHWKLWVPRPLKKKTWPLKRGWTPWAASHFFLAKIWPAHYFAWGVRMWKLVLKVRISGFGYPNCWIGFQTWQVHPGGGLYFRYPLETFAFSAFKKSLSLRTAEPIGQKDHCRKGFGEIKGETQGQMGKRGHSKPVQTTAACYRHAANFHHHDTNRDL